MQIRESVFDGIKYFQGSFPIADLSCLLVVNICCLTFSHFEIDTALSLRMGVLSCGNMCE